tara:strand:+ start:475 stop:699 length:225 start_codon:yes stop_codon:yes gene_type:complete
MTTHLNVEGKTRLEAFNMMLDTPEFKNILSEKTIVYLKNMVKIIHEDGYNKGFHDAGDVCNKTFSRICDSLAGN